MSDQLLTYYYFLREDEAAYDTLRSFLRSQGWAPAGEALDVHSCQTEPRFYELDSGNVRIFVLHKLLPSLSWDQLTEKINETAGVLNSDLLGTVRILIANNTNAQVVRAELSEHLKNSPLRFELLDGEAWRYAETSSQVFYTAFFKDWSPQHNKYFAKYLPLIELTVIRLQMLARLLRERNQAVTRERAELDKQLNQILHTDLVRELPQGHIIEEYEQHLNSLSTGYGKIVNDYALMQDGYQRLSALLEQLGQQLVQEPSCRFSEDTKQQMYQPFERMAEELSRTLNELRFSRESHQAAIEVVRSRIELLLSKENIATQSQIRSLMEINTAVQKQSLTFQFAAGLIEFIVLAYYSHSLWKALAPDAYHALAGWIQLVFVILFSGTTVYMTHLLAEYLQGDKHVKQKLLFFSLFLLVILLVVLMASVMLSGAAAH